MKKQQYSTVALTTIFLFLGVIIGVQYNTVKKQGISTENRRLSELTTTLNLLREERDSLEKQLKEQEKLIEGYEAGSQSEEGEAAEAKQLRKFAGLTVVSGSGLVVTMSDSSTKKGGDSNAYIIHAEDILAVVNELNSAGAEAVSVNGQRIIGKSAITCAGSIIMVNGVRVAAPFEILAVGDGDVMQSALKFPGGVVDNLAPWGIEITMKKEGVVTVPAYTQTDLWKKEEEE